MQVFTKDGRIIMFEGKIGSHEDCCDLTCDNYGGQSGGGGGCNDDIPGICCVPGTGGTCGEATQCGCDAAGGTWRFAELDGPNKCGPAELAGFVDQSGNAYTVCSCDAGQTVTVVWAHKQRHPDYDPNSGDPAPFVACHKCRTFVDIGVVEEFIQDGFSFTPLEDEDPPSPISSVSGYIVCGDQDCFDKTRDPPYLWQASSDLSEPGMPGSTTIYGQGCNQLDNNKILPCQDLDGDGDPDGYTGDVNIANPCADPGDPLYSSCTCDSPFYFGFGSGVWSSGTTWDPCEPYGYDGAGPCC